jgi:hypothetical protein
MKDRVLCEKLLIEMSHYLGRMEEKGFRPLSCPWISRYWLYEDVRDKRRE